VRAHGTLARYVVDHCRCQPCRNANRVYENNRTRQIAYGRWQPYVNAEPVRAYARALMEFGIGSRRLAGLAGVPTGVMSKLIYGGPGTRPPSRRVRPATAAKILAVKPSLELLGATVSVDATGTARRLQALVALGWSQAKLAAALGVGPPNLFKTMNSPAVYAETARKVRALYDELWDQPPPESTHRDKIAASRARNVARTKGWLPPMAWDDNEIDDPTVRPKAGRARQMEVA
jgi:hypothetical protein